MDFIAELQKLLDAEEDLPFDPLLELVQMQAKSLENIDKTNNSISLQTEEIYDIIKESDNNVHELKASAKRETLLLNALVSISDLLDGLLSYIQEHSQTVIAKKVEAMNACGLEQLGFPGERLDPRLHMVFSAEYSNAPLESVIRVLENGYAYRGKIIRRATVILSKGEENA